MAKTTTQNSRNPANNDELSGMLQEVLGKYLQQTDNMLPAEVLSYDRETNRVAVRPLIKLLRTDGESIERAPIASLPVFQLGGGGCVITFNILPGDIGWIKANDRDVSGFLRTETDAPPGTLRKHSFSDAVFFPDQFRRWTLDIDDAEATVLQTLDATQRISISQDRIRLTSATDIHLEADRDINLIAGNAIKIQAAFTLDIDAIFGITIDSLVDIVMNTTRNFSLTAGNDVAMTAENDFGIVSNLEQVRLVAPGDRVLMTAPFVQISGTGIQTDGDFVAFGNIGATGTLTGNTAVVVFPAGNPQVGLGTHGHPQVNTSDGASQVDSLASVPI